GGASPARRGGDGPPVPQGGPWGAQARGPASFSAPLFRTSQHRAAGADAAAVQRQPQAPPQPASAPPFYWVPTVDTVGEFEVGGACGEVVSKHGDYGDHDSAPPIAGTLRMSRGGLYLWTLQIVRQCPHRPQLQFGIHGANHSRPWRRPTRSQQRSSAHRTGYPRGPWRALSGSCPPHYS
ncbi:unnamed protein product, partial [Prorocentrum cordatum]